VPQYSKDDGPRANLPDLSDVAGDSPMLRSAKFSDWDGGDMLHLGIGGNNLLAEVPVATMQQNVRDIWTKYKTVTGKTDAVLVTTTMPYCDVAYPDIAQWDEYFDGIVEVTEELGDMCVDLRELFPEPVGRPGPARRQRLPPVGRWPQSAKRDHGPVPRSELDHGAILPKR